MRKKLNLTLTSASHLGLGLQPDTSIESLPPASHYCTVHLSLLPHSAGHHMFAIKMAKRYGPIGKLRDQPKTIFIKRPPEEDPL